LTALLALEPREAGTDAIEPVADFPDSGEGSQGIVMCLVSQVCQAGSHTWNCIATQ
jgi:hypothetical protein